MDGRTTASDPTVASRPPAGWLILDDTSAPARWAGRHRSVVLVPLLPDEVSDLLEKGSATPTLTPAEEDLTALVAEGSSTKAIASQLGLTTRTVERRLAKLRDHFGVRSTGELTALLARMGR